MRGGRMSVIHNGRIITTAAWNGRYAGIAARGLSHIGTPVIWHESFEQSFDGWTISDGYLIRGLGIEAIVGSPDGGYLIKAQSPNYVDVDIVRGLGLYQISAVRRTDDGFDSESANEVAVADGPSVK